MKKRLKDKGFSGVKSKFSPLYLILGIALLIYASSLIAVLLWALSTSFKNPLIDFELGNYVGLPKKIYFKNYLTVFDKFYVVVSTSNGREPVYFPELFKNSVMFALGNAFVQVSVTFIVAYAAARFKFVIGKVIYGIVIFGMILPIVGSQPSAIVLARQLGLYDSMLGMYVHKFNFLGMYFLVMHATLSAFPKDFDEAAQIDGANNLSVMLRIMLPLCSTTYFTILLLVFIAQWNDYTTPMLFLPSIPTISYGLRLMEGTDNATANTPVRMAACLVGAIPTLVLFMIFHDRLLNNLSIGGVKE